MATTATSSEEVRSSVSSIYSELLNKRKLERESKEEKKFKEKEERKQKKEEKNTKEDGTKMTKKERRQAEMDSWKEVIIGLTGDDLEYSDSNKKGTKKKYRKWIDDDSSSGNAVLTPKPKKVKKRNYHKEFEPELHMLKAIVADQNKFTIDLQKRFQNAVGPATKDAMPPNKTMVDLAAAINASRANSLGFLREIGNLKKNIADLYMKQKKMDMELNGGNMVGSTTDLGLLGSNIASSLFGSGSPGASYDTSSYNGGYQSSNQNTDTQTSVQVFGTNSNQADNCGIITVNAEPFDPSTWDGGPELANNSVLFETVPHSIVVEWDKVNSRARFKAVRDDTGEELIGCPIPTSDPSKLSFNEKDMIVRGEFDENYKLEIV